MFFAFHHCFRMIVRVVIEGRDDLPWYALVLVFTNTSEKKVARSGESMPNLCVRVLSKRFMFKASCS